VAINGARDLVGGEGGGLAGLVRSSKAVWLVVGSGTKVSVDSHKAVTLVVVDLCAVGLVDRDLEVVWAKAVAMSIRVGEEATLKHLVKGGLDTWNHVRRGEG
jgi:hypothetical protein